MSITQWYQGIGKVKHSSVLRTYGRKSRNGGYVVRHCLGEDSDSVSCSTDSRAGRDWGRVEGLQKMNSELESLQIRDERMTSKNCCASASSFTAP